ncbi:hypothetical protein CPT_Sansa11 [Caulobacter phage Sansa]|uniref:Uncharacterized protein n=1 Tax=Caulobacter phage Sansa TaxID=1675600 RepID=A0A0K1LMR1_9CAUD|nr:hypothetical protein HOR07_gp011 [Caulobacter phage Sansa]AKU43415.1 hypothetical protein CPT_Sansa11 [Caulobacter phage Sansa]
MRLNYILLSIVTAVAGLAASFASFAVSMFERVSRAVAVAFPYAPREPQVLPSLISTKISFAGAALARVRSFASRRMARVKPGEVYSIPVGAPA